MIQYFTKRCVHVGKVLLASSGQDLTLIGTVRISIKLTVSTTISKGMHVGVVKLYYFGFC